jgi:AraC-like DNA-binding protein
MPTGNLVLTRAPGPGLLPFVDTLWAVESRGDTTPAPPRREHVLPTGQMHLVFRLAGGPLRIFHDGSGREGRPVGRGVVGGARSAYYVREFSNPSSSVGAQLRPGAAEALFGVTADELADRHTSLDDLWGREAAWVAEQLMEPAMVHQRIDRLESILAARLCLRRTMPHVVPFALERLRSGASIRRVVEASGYSHRTVLTLFRQSVGLTPKAYGRVLRFQRVLARISSATALAELAIAAGYSDQAHFSREFKAFAGVTPTEYRQSAPERQHHVGVTRPGR